MASPDPDSLSRIVMLAFGAMDHGGPYWCYVAVKPSRYDEFRKVMATKKYNIQQFAGDDYGEIIVSGEGVTPPQDVTKKVAELFNVPIRELFADADPRQTIATKIQSLKPGQPAT
jgi:hypothetical protein